MPACKRGAMPVSEQDEKSISKWDAAKNPCHPTNLCHLSSKTWIVAVRQQERQIVIGAFRNAGGAQKRF